MVSGVGVSVSVRILGRLDVGGSVLRLPAQAQALLGVLLLRANELVSTQRLADELWGEHPPASWVNALQVYVSRVRKELARTGVPVTVARHGPGYVLAVAPELVDA